LHVLRESYAQPLVSVSFGIRKLHETSPPPEWVSLLELGTICNQATEAATKFVKFNVSSDFIKKIHYFTHNFSFASEFLILKETQSFRKRRVTQNYAALVQSIAWPVTYFEDLRA
jgi:hypothetical protein